MSTNSYRPRLSVEISQAQQQKLQQYLDYGMQKRVFSIVVDDVIKMIEKHREKFLAAVLSRNINFEDYSSLEMEEKDEQQKRRP